MNIQHVQIDRHVTSDLKRNVGIKVLQVATYTIKVHIHHKIVPNEIFVHRY